MRKWWFTGVQEWPCSTLLQLNRINDTLIYLKAKRYRLGKQLYAGNHPFFCGIKDDLHRNNQQVGEVVKKWFAQVILRWPFAFFIPLLSVTFYPGSFFLSRLGLVGSSVFYPFSHFAATYATKIMFLQTSLSRLGERCGTAEMIYGNFLTWGRIALTKSRSMTGTTQDRAGDFVNTCALSLGKTIIVAAVDEPNIINEFFISASCFLICVTNVTQIK